MPPPPAALLLVDKPKGWTSHDVVAVVRGRLKTKVGHSGTLDPMATGLLVLLLGSATKSAARFLGLPKVYSGSIRLGLETASGDLDGAIEREAPVPELGAEALRAAFDRLTGELDVPIPRYSAVKHRGKPLYAYARAGIETPPKTRRSRVFRWELLDWRSPEAAFRLECSSGTYVRSLAALAGRELSCPATLSSLRRERVGDYAIENALTIERIRGAELSELKSWTIPCDA